MTKPEPAYIGAARDRARARRLTELDEQLDVLDEQLAGLDEQLDGVEQRRAQLAEELAAQATSRWEAQLTQVFDYTAWHRFIVTVDLGEGTGPRQVTRKLHGTLSGGEKAIVLHLPLFAALAAHDEVAPHAPRLVLLDEVFVGIDPSNRGQLLDLLRGFDLDAVLTSDREWCTYAELDGIAIHQLLTDEIDKAVTTARFIWTGTALE